MGERIEKNFNENLRDLNRIIIESGIGTGTVLTMAEYATTLDRLYLPERTYNALRRSLLRTGRDFSTLGLILSAREDELRSVRDLGDHSYSDLIHKLVKKGFLPQPDLEETSS